VLGAVEKDADAARSYVANHPKVKVFENDIREISPREMIAALKLPVGERLDLIAGCPPCQGFTRLTENNGRRDRRNSLIREFLRFVVELKPKTCMMENVPGLLTRGKHYFQELKLGLEEAGYSVTYQVVELANYGVPQFRRRLVVLASRSGSIAIPRATHADPKNARKIKRTRPWRTVRSVLSGMPTPPLRSAVKAGTAKCRLRWHYARDLQPIVRKRLKHSLGNGAGRSKLPAALRLACHDRRPDGFYDVYGAMNWDEPAPTMTSGCTNASKGRFGHPKFPRPLTAREAALLQSFPRSYKFEGSGLESVARQIGNALPRRFAKVVGAAVYKQLRSATGSNRS